MATQEASRTVLHVGCGPPNPQKLHPTFRAAGWKEVRLDIDPGVKPDIVADIVDMSPVATASVHAVWSSHNVEHLYAHQVPTALDEFHRVLQPGGFALITLPDLQAVCRYIAEDKLEDVLYQSPAGPIHPIDVVYARHRPSIGRPATCRRFSLQAGGDVLRDRRVRLLVLLNDATAVGEQHQGGDQPPGGITEVAQDSKHARQSSHGRHHSKCRAITGTWVLSPLVPTPKSNGIRSCSTSHITSYQLP